MKEMHGSGGVLGMVSVWEAPQPHGIEATALAALAALLSRCDHAATANQGQTSAAQTGDRERGDGHMAASIARVAAAALLTLIVGSMFSGCLVGPSKDREHALVLSHWKRNRQRPILIDPDWEYRGEYMSAVIDPERTAELAAAEHTDE